MPQLDFILNYTDQKKLFDYAFSLGCYYVPLKDYSTNEYEVYNSTDYYQFMKMESQLYILNDLYTTFPLVMDSIDKDNQDVYFIKQRNGGPTIDFYAPNLIEESEALIGRGAISHYPSYYNDNRELIPSDALREMYGKLTKYIKKNSLRFKSGVRYYWIGMETIKAIQRNEIKIVDGGPSSNDLNEEVLNYQLK